MPKSLTNRLGLQERVCCPHCWERFPPEQTLWISSSPALRGDPRLGADEQQRFSPERYTVEGDALDRRGFPCQDLACPNCHLPVPRGFLEMQPLFTSIIGAPGSGKSVFLGAMAGELRNILVRDFCLSFSDADPEMNELIISYENALLELNGNNHGDGLTMIASKVPKTVAGNFTHSVRFENGDITYPNPFVFALQPTNGHPNLASGRKLARVACLYDNAGESFEPGQDAVVQPYTRHLAEAQTLFLVIDPTQDADFQKELRRKEYDLRFCGSIRRQDSYINEAARRIRKFSRMRDTDKFNSPVVVVLTKCDVWWQLTGLGNPPPEPFRQLANLPIRALDVEAVETVSRGTQSRLREICPRLTNAIEAFFSDVTYVPISATGWETTIDPKSGKPAVRSGAECQRHWVCVPFIYALRRIAPTLIAQLKR